MAPPRPSPNLISVATLAARRKSLDKMGKPFLSSIKQWCQHMVVRYGCYNLYEISILFASSSDAAYFHDTESHEQFFFVFLTSFR